MTDDQFRVLAGLLLEIRDLLVLSVTPEPEHEGCPHPEDRRISFATPAEPERWICAACRYEHGVMHAQ